MKRFFRGRFFTVLVLIVCFLLGFMLSVAVNGHTMPHEQLIGIIVSPVRTGFTWCKNQVTHFFSSITQYDELEAENALLREQLAQAQQDQAAAEAERDQLKSDIEKALSATPAPLPEVQPTLAPDA